MHVSIFSWKRQIGQSNTIIINSSNDALNKMHCTLQATCISCHSLSEWAAFRIQLTKTEAERFEVYPLGKLRSGVDLIAVCKVTGSKKDKKRFLELYSCKDVKTVQCSASMEIDDSSELFVSLSFCFLNNVSIELIIINFPSLWFGGGGGWFFVFNGPPNYMETELKH